VKLTRARQFHPAIVHRGAIGNDAFALDRSNFAN